MDTRHEVTAWLKLINVTPSDKNRAGWVVAPCPLAPWRHRSGKDADPSFAVRLEPGDNFSNCFACGWHGSLSDLVVELMVHKAPGSLNEALERAEKEAANAPLIPPADDAQEPPEPWPEWWLDSFPPWAASPETCAYLDERRTPARVADLLDLRYDGYRKRVVFPVRDELDRLVGAQGRSVAGADLRYLSYTYDGRNSGPVLLGEHWLDYDYPVLLVEGPFDLARCLQVYRNTAAVLTASINAAKVRRLRWATHVVTLFDEGTGGDAGRAAVDKHLRKTRVSHVLPDGAKDPGDMYPYPLASLLSKTLKLTDVWV